MILVNTFDVEPWWATVPRSVPLVDWDSMPDRGIEPLVNYLNLCDQYKVKGTFFFVAWYAKKYPNRLKEVVSRGHEVGCHSLFHDDVAHLSLDKFRIDCIEAKKILEDISATRVISYRAPSFSFPPNRAGELLNVLHESGYLIDSSISSARRFYGGSSDYRSLSKKPGSMINSYGANIFEIPVPGINFFNTELPIFGGGYLRITPSYLINYLIKKEDYQVLYLHPHDFDNQIPYLNSLSLVDNVRRKLKYGSLENKISILFEKCEVYSCREIYSIKYNE